MGALFGASTRPAAPANAGMAGSGRNFRADHISASLLRPAHWDRSGCAGSRPVSSRKSLTKHATKTIERRVSDRCPDRSVHPAALRGSIMAPAVASLGAVDRQRHLLAWTSRRFPEEQREEKTTNAPLAEPVHNGGAAEPPPMDPGRCRAGTCPRGMDRANA